MHVTPQARNELHQMLLRALEMRHEQKPPPEEMSLRLVPSGDGEATGLGLTLDAPASQDEIVEHQGRSILALDAGTSALLEDLTLDLVETPEGARLGIVE